MTKQSILAVLEFATRALRADVTYPGPEKAASIFWPMKAGLSEAEVGLDGSRIEREHLAELRKAFEHGEPQVISFRVGLFYTAFVTAQGIQTLKQSI